MILLWMNKDCASFIHLCKVAVVCLPSAAGDGLSSEQKQLQSEALKFACQEMAPHMKNWDEEVAYMIFQRNVAELLGRIE